MRFLGMGKDGSLGDMYLALSRMGHEVRVFIQDPQWRGILRGFLQITHDWKQELDWLHRGDGILIFERADQGELQDQLRKEGFHVIGGSAFGDRIENDRGFGQSCMRAAGMKTASVQQFNSFESALAFIASRPRRYVLKLNGSDHSSSSNVVGEMENGQDIAALLRHHKARSEDQAPPNFILMDHVRGVEVGVGGYFNGEAFLDPVVMDWEHKRFFPGDLGELTGEMGTLVTYRGGEILFQETLGRMAEQLRAGGYVGYINLNTIVDSNGIWPLEFTSRFGYPGAAICSVLHLEGWDVLFRRMINKDRLDFPTKAGFAVGVVLTVPPFPVADAYSEQSKGLPVLFRQPLSPEDEANIQMSEVELADGCLITTGGMGSLMAITGTGDSVESAREAAYRRCENIVVPGLRYRNDIGLRFISHDRWLLQQAGLYPNSPAD